MLYCQICRELLCSHAQSQASAFILSWEPLQGEHTGHPEPLCWPRSDTAAALEPQHSVTSPCFDHKWNTGGFQHKTLWNEALCQWGMRGNTPPPNSSLPPRLCDDAEAQCGTSVLGKLPRTIPISPILSLKHTFTLALLLPRASSLKALGDTDINPTLPWSTLVQVSRSSQPPATLELHPCLQSGATETTMRKLLAQVILCEHINPQISGILSHLFVQKHQWNAIPALLKPVDFGLLLQDAVAGDLPADPCACTQNTSHTRGGACPKPDFTEREETQRSDLTEDKQERP